MSVSQFIRNIRARPSTEAFANPYNCYEQNLDACHHACRQRQIQLHRYLAYRKTTARIILLAEAPGYQGARFSGLAMTSERLLSGERNILREGDVFGREGFYRRTSHLQASGRASVRIRGFAEPTATVVWKEITRAGVQRDVVLGNTFPFHPHQPDNRLSNRPPSNLEITDAARFLTELRGLFAQECAIVAVGNIARDHLRELGIQARHVRHPAYGRANDFREGIRDIFRELGPDGV